LLKTVGFGRRQVGATIAWQATTLAVVGLVAGIPIGLLIGREVWRRAADNLGVATGSTMPTLALVVTGVSALVLVNVIAFVPGRAASRTRPAVALREE
jgi:ABC-type lipoprotein release transport system permease subunit